MTKPTDPDDLTRTPTDDTDAPGPRPDPPLSPWRTGADPADLSRQPDADPARMTVADLRPDDANRRRHPTRNLDMLVDALRVVGAARSIVVDEDNVVLAGNGVVDAATRIGLTNVRVIDVDGDTLIAVRRSGLTPEQKHQLAMFDNRVAELAEWNPDQLQLDIAAGLSLTPYFTTDEVDALFASAVPLDLSHEPTESAVKGMKTFIAVLTTDQFAVVDGVLRRAVDAGLGDGPSSQKFANALVQILSSWT